MRLSGRHPFWFQSGERRRAGGGWYWARGLAGGEGRAARRGVSGWCSRDCRGLVSLRCSRAGAQRAVRSMRFGGGCFNWHPVGTDADTLDAAARNADFSQQSCRADGIASIRGQRHGCLEQRQKQGKPDKSAGGCGVHTVQFTQGSSSCQSLSVPQCTSVRLSVHVPLCRELLRHAPHGRHDHAHRPS